MSEFDWNKRNSAPLGTPENPEILDPGGYTHAERDVGGSQSTQARRPRFAPIGGRIARAFQIMMWMVYASAPALLFDSIWFWLYEMGTGDGGFFAWFLLILVTPPAFLLTVIAMVVNSFLLLIFFANLLGRQIAPNPAGYVRFFKLG